MKTIKERLEYTDQKVHSVRYDSLEQKPVVRTLYVGNAAFEGPLKEVPKRIDITIVSGETS